MLAGARAAYEVRRIPCLRVCMSRVGGVRWSVGRTLESRGMPTRVSARRVREACR